MQALALILRLQHVLSRSRRYTQTDVVATGTTANTLGASIVDEANHLTDDRSQQQKTPHHFYG